MIYPYFGQAPKKAGGSPILPSFLPQVGPYADQGPFLASDYPDITYSTNQMLFSSEDEPLRYNNITISNGVLLTGTQKCFFFHCNTITFGNSTSLNVDGDDGQDAPDVFNGGMGGDGGSGGGGGGASSLGSCSTSFGGFGGDGSNGTSGFSFGCGYLGGNAGTGFGVGNTTGNFIYPVGGTNSFGNPPSGPWGFAGNGGDAGTCALGPGASGGGGAGAGMILIMTNRLIFNPASPPSFFARGGSGGISVGAGSSAGLGAGGGVVLGFFKSIQSAASVIAVTGGSSGGCGSPGGNGKVFSYEVDHAGTSILNTYPNWTHVWNNV